MRRQRRFLVSIVRVIGGGGAAARLVRPAT
jgi:hypothetical protein